MSFVWMAVLALAALPDSPADSASASQNNIVESSDAGSQAAAEPTPRSAVELRAAVRDALRRSARTARPNPWELAPELIGLFGELVRDQNIAKEDRLKYRGIVRNRLMAMAKQMERELAELDEEKPLPDERPVVARIVRGGPGEDILAQQPGGGAPGGGFAGFGPGAGGPGGAGAGFGPRDHGQELVDLIKRTIAPETWNDMGGPGSIYYFRPLRVLVIRQTSEVHGRLGGVLGGLRQAP